jgi:hypothetical protein
METSKTTPTRIIVEAILDDGGNLSDRLRSLAAERGLDHAHAVVMAEEYVKQIIETSLEGSLLPEFAMNILSHSLMSQVDWRYVGERALVSPENN